MQKTKDNKKLQQSLLSTDCLEESTNEELYKDFDTLANTPLSKGGHFVLKAEKDWFPVNQCTNEFSELYTLNLTTLSSAIDCIPFNEYVNIDNKYFTKDQLTSIYNDSEKGKLVYRETQAIQNVSKLLNITSLKNEMNESKRLNHSSEKVESMINMKNTKEKSIDNLEEDDVEFLLSLTEPVKSDLTTITQPFCTTHNNDSKSKSKNTPIKPIDLEKWLVTILDD